MSKSVTIPTDGMNPFVVISNGVKYVYTPGETVTVPDGVALEIEEYKRWRDKYSRPASVPFGAQSDLSQNDPDAADYVKNRTHYSYEAIKTLWEEFGVGSHMTYESIRQDPYVNEIEVEIYSMVSGALLYKETLQRNRGKIVPLGETYFYGNADLREAAGAELYGTGGSVAGCPILIFCGEGNPGGWSLYFDESLLEEQDRYGVYRFLIKSPTETETIYVPFDEKYAPSTIPRVRYVAPGQTIVVKSVDDHGKPTEWEAVDLPSTDLEIEIGNTEVTNGDILAHTSIKTGTAQAVADKIHAGEIPTVKITKRAKHENGLYMNYAELPVAVDATPDSQKLTLIGYDGINESQVMICIDLSTNAITLANAMLL